MTRKYHVCGWPVDSVQHLRGCVSKREWPDWMRKPKSVAVIDAVVNIERLYAEAMTCECGYEAKNAAALRLHRMKSKLHQEPVNA